MDKGRSRSLQRRGPVREPYERVLIVCEGEKTEPHYLDELIRHYQLSSANVTVTGKGGAAPISVVDHAIELFEQDPDYDAVFCVFDRDGHTTFDRAVQRIQEKKLARRAGRKKVGKARFEAITSIPCFEYWILLHFEHTTAPMPRYAILEPRLRAVAELRGYEKGARGLFQVTHPHLQAALRNADRANQAAQMANTDNPTTRVPVLIRYLLGLAEKRRAR